MALWIKLSGNPNQQAHDQTMVFDKKRKSVFAILHMDETDAEPRLIEYSFNTNSWIKYQIQAKSDTPFELRWYNPIAIDCEENEIYLCNNPNQITEFKIMDNHIAKIEKITDLNEIIIGKVFGSGIMIKNEFHIIGGVLQNNHIRYNPNEQKCEVLHDLVPVIKVNTVCFANTIKVQEKILIFGGSNNDNVFDVVGEYDILNDAWYRLKIKLPKALVSVELTPILNGQFILLLGGINNFTTMDIEDSIYIYSVNDKTFRESNVKLPEEASFKGFAIKDVIKDRLATFGWIRDQWSECGIDNHLFPPEYLIKIICAYYINEWIHLFNIDNYQHYKIDVFDIINC